MKVFSALAIAGTSQAIYLNHPGGMWDTWGAYAPYSPIPFGGYGPAYPPAIGPYDYGYTSYGPRSSWMGDQYGTESMDWFAAPETVTILLDADELAHLNPFETVPESWKMTLEDVKASRDEKEDKDDSKDGKEQGGHAHPEYAEGSNYITIWPDDHEDYQEGDYKQSDYDKIKNLDQLYPEEDFMWIDDQDNAEVKECDDYDGEEEKEDSDGSCGIACGGACGDSCGGHGGDCGHGCGGSCGGHGSCDGSSCKGHAPGSCGGHGSCDGSSCKGHAPGECGGHAHPQFDEGSGYLTIWPDDHEDYQEGDLRQSDYDLLYTQDDLEPWYGDLYDPYYDIEEYDDSSYRRGAYGYGYDDYGYDDYGYDDYGMDYDYDPYYVDEYDYYPEDDYYYDDYDMGYYEDMYDDPYAYDDYGYDDYYYPEDTMYYY